MTLIGFVSKIKGEIKGYPTDKDYLGECLSLVKIYLRDVFGITPPSSGVNAAYGYWTNFPAPLPTYFKKVAYKSGLKPKAGDIIIWGTGIGKYGHIAIVYNNITTSSFTSFDQNWNGKDAHLQNHNYSGVLGWLTPKGDSMTCKEDLAECEAKSADRLKRLNEYTPRMVKAEEKVKELEKQIILLEASIQETTTLLKVARQDLEEADREIRECKENSLGGDKNLSAWDYIRIGIRKALGIE